MDKEVAKKPPEINQKAFLKIYKSFYASTSATFFPISAGESTT